MTIALRDSEMQTPPSTTAGCPSPGQIREAKSLVALARAMLVKEEADSAIARVLLERALSAIVAGSHGSVDDGSSPDAPAQHLRSRLAEQLPRDQLVEVLEATVALVDEQGLDSRRGASSRRAQLLLLGSLAALAALAIPIFSYFRYPSDKYEWRASSSTKGFASSGFLGQLDAFGLVLHTGYERAPWVEIDLEQVRTIERVIVRQRLDCCQNQGLPMVIELAGEDKQWRQVAEKTTPFDSWVARFSPQTARWVRIRSTAKSTAIQVREVRID